jgi:hypothetical protein
MLPESVSLRQSFQEQIFYNAAISSKDYGLTCIGNHMEEENNG